MRTHTISCPHQSLTKPGMMPQFWWLSWYCHPWCYHQLFPWTGYEDRVKVPLCSLSSYWCQMRLLWDMFVKIVINDHLYNVLISLVHIKSWCCTLSIFVNLIIFLLLSQTSYNFIKKKPDLVSNGTLKIGFKSKWKFLVKICPNSFLVTFGPLDSWLV